MHRSEVCILTYPLVYPNVKTNVGPDEEVRVDVEGWVDASIGISLGVGVYRKTCSTSWAFQKLLFPGCFNWK